MRVHPLIDQGFRPDAVTANVADQIAHHANGRQRARRRAALGQRGEGRQRKEPKAAACNG
jgi:hypothetical protein